MSATFVLDGQEFFALDGGSAFTFTPASNCETQAEVHELWEELSAGGSPQRCGWLQDKFGVL